MEKYIKKDAVVAELEDWRDKIKKGIFSIPLTGSDRAYATFEYEILGKVRDFLETIETKEVDEIIKNAEDHAYFAGSENTREKLINEACKWWEDELSYPSMTPEEIKWYKGKVRKFRKDMEDE